MVRPKLPDDPEGLESNEGKHLHYYNLIVVIPPVLDDKGKVVSLLREVKLYEEFVGELLESIEPYKTSGFESLKIFDVAELELSFAEVDDVNLYLILIKKISRGLNSPLICFMSLGATTEDIVQDISLAQETEGYTKIDTALFNAPDPREIWEDITKEISYIVGRGATKYQIQNIIEHGHKGPLLSTTQIIEHMNKKRL